MQPMSSPFSANIYKLARYKVLGCDFSAHRQQSVSGDFEFTKADFWWYTMFGKMPHSSLLHSFRFCLASANLDSNTLTVLIILNLNNLYILQLAKPPIKNIVLTRE